MINWHRLFGLTLIDYFTESSYRVELEKDLSVKQQLLDVLIIEHESASQLVELADGLESLARHNLMTYKSSQQPLDGWALDELVGHYVNYRKQISPSSNKLLPTKDFGLYAVSTRRPEKLQTGVALKRVKKGVYDVRWWSGKIRIIVLSEVPRVVRNAIWLLFSDILENVQFAATQYKWHHQDLSTVMNSLYEYYDVEKLAMSYTVEDYRRELREQILSSITTEELLKRWSLEELLKRLPPEERLKGVPAEERLKGVPAEERLKGVPSEEILKMLSREEIEAYLKKLPVSN